MITTTEHRHVELRARLAHAIQDIDNQAQRLRHAVATQFGLDADDLAEVGASPPLVATLLLGSPDGMDIQDFLEMGAVMATTSFNRMAVEQGHELPELLRLA